MGTGLLILMLVLLAAPGVLAAESPIKGWDLYGTSRITIEEIREKLGTKIEKASSAWMSGDIEGFVKLDEELTREIKAMGPFAYAHASAITYFTPGRPVYVTVDVVEEQDWATRMDFLPPPMKELPDPDGLIALWKEYEKTGAALRDKGELKGQDTKPPAFHSLYGFEHPELKRFEEPVRTGARKNKERLIEILRNDRDDQHRGMAAFLLAHIEDGNELVRVLLPSVRDPSNFVRNNVMRVLIFVAKDHPEIDVPIQPILKAIDYPDVSDRNKSLYVLDGLADRKGSREILIREAGPKLLRILRLTQPNNHDPAYSILKKISGKDLGDRDYPAWEVWLRSVRRD